MEARAECARQGMVGVLDTFMSESARTFANRKADGLNPIDSAVAALKGAWDVEGGAGAKTGLKVQALLKACADWRDERKFLGARVTGWRAPSVKKLYWQVAWSYSCDNYAKKARLLALACKESGQLVCTKDPVASTDALGNPYDYVGASGYAHPKWQRRPPLLRGDTRGPSVINEAGGFLPRDVESAAAYKPWFAGHSTGHTISTTEQETLAIDACPAAKAKKIATKPGNLPAWVNVELIGFVYELGGLENSHATHRQRDSVGLEHIFIAIPKSCITRWWVVMPDRRTIGPVPFPVPTEMPEGLKVSDKKDQLA